LFPAIAGQDPFDEPDIDDLGVQGTPTGVLDRISAMAASTAGTH
jgi:hypothetical protein